MTDEQLKEIALAVDAIGDAVVDIGNGLQQIAVAMLAPPPIDPPPPPVDPPPIEPPPPVVEESEFIRAVVLNVSDDGRFQPHESHGFAASPKFNVVGKSWGLSVKLFHHTPPTGTSPLSLWDDSSPQWQVKVPGPTRLAVAFKLTAGGYDGLDVVVDDLTGRWVHVVIGYDYQEMVAEIWIDGVMRGSKNCAGIGHSADSTPPLIVNSTAAGHAPGDISIDELVYAVGAAPTQADVDKLSGLTPHEPGRFVTLENGKLVAAVYGPESAKDWETPKGWVDGKFVELVQVRNNPPVERKWRE